MSIEENEPLKRESVTTSNRFLFLKLFDLPDFRIIYLQEPIYARLSSYRLAKAMRERSQQSLGGHVLYVGLFRYPGMLHRAKYSRFRNDSITSLDEGTQNTSLNIKGSSSSSHSSSPNLLAEDASLGPQDTCSTLCTLIPRMANIKLANPSNLPGLKSFCLGMKEVPRIKLTECVTIPSSPTSPEISCLSASYPQPDLDRLALIPKAAGDCAVGAAEEAAPLGRQDRSLAHSRESVGEPGTTYSVRVSTSHRVSVL